MNKDIDQLPLNIKRTLSRLKENEKNNNLVIHLTANEAIMSPLANAWQSSVLSSRYILGSIKERNKQESYFFKKNFLVRGIPAFDELESLATRACKKMFYCQECEFAPLSGLHAMIALIGALTKPGDLVMTLPPQYIGHYATAPLLRSMGRQQIFLPYSSEKFELDLEKLKQIGKLDKIRMVYLDTMHYFNPYPLEKIREILPKAILVYDASHILGLIAGGQFQTPLLEGADIVSGNTHKTMPGPQKGIILYRDKDLARKSSMVAETFTSSRHTHSAISLFITLLEMKDFGKEYARQIVKNTQVLAKSLHRNGFNLMSYSRIEPRTHQLLIQIDNLKESSKLIEAGISVNALPLFNGLPLIRIGTQQVTRLGMKEREMEHIADFITRVLKEKKINCVKKEVEKLAKKFSKVQYCFRLS